jgi:UDP-N-acetylmuramyl pentapeptide phosphotransferase/UDP-N-acetylglucosamine-1-phosphate transferase
MLGPVYNAAHSTPTIGGAVFPIVIALPLLVYVWWRFLASEDKQSKPTMEKMIGLSLILCTMIALGIWELVRAVRISN